MQIPDRFNICPMTETNTIFHMSVTVLVIDTISHFIPDLSLARHVPNTTLSQDIIPLRISHDIQPTNYINEDIKHSILNNATISVSQVIIPLSHNRENGCFLILSKK